MAVEVANDTMRLANGLSADLLSAGAGDAVVYLHGRLGRQWHGFLDGLASSHRVISPLHPGVTDEDDLTFFDSIHDLVLYYDDLFTALELDHPVLIGHSFGGMVAAEYAAHFPEKVSRLVLIDPLGLWLDDAPIGDIDATPAPHLPALMFKDPAQPESAAALAVPDDPQEQAATMIQRMAVIAATNHFIWPIPDRNLQRRLHRISCPTLLIWGEDDRYVPTRYAELFADGIKESEVSTITGAGHHPHIEQESLVAGEVNRFLG